VDAITHDDHDHVGARLRRLRLSQKITLTDLSRRLGVSKSQISQVERGLSNPSLSLLRSLANALDVPLFTLFVEDEVGDGVVRHDNRQQLHVPGSSVARELLVPDLHRRMFLVFARIEPGESTSADCVSHHGEECVVVLRGRVDIEVNANRLSLDRGDSFYFDSKLPHVFRNSSDEPAEFIAAISPSRPL
jgi:transcriptional regulator with XRE-family HTH domain